MRFENNFFQKMIFEPSQIQQYFDSAKHDLDIAKGSKIPDVTFKFSYDALVKIGITLISKRDYKVRSNIGHHIKIIEKLSQILDDKNIFILGNKMRKERNFNLYDGITFISKKESREYLAFVCNVYSKAEEIISSN